MTTIVAPAGEDAPIRRIGAPRHTRVAPPSTYSVWPVM